MVSIGTDTLEAYHQKFPKGAHVLVQSGQDAHFLCLFGKYLGVIGIPRCGLMKFFIQFCPVFLLPGRQDLVLELVSLF